MNAVTTDLEQQSLRDFSEKAYRGYSIYVMLDRALPHIEDGLKPVQRRIIYAMSELGLDAQAKYKKSARTIGDVLGKFHPHGDTACYEAMVLMAQDFSYRYRLVDGQGNWGSQDDPKSFAAMRYTEAKLSPYAELLLQELGQGTVEWQANFDGTLEEPKLLPARIPNILLNGATGIAVGMATDIPPHNLTEVVAAVVYLLDHPKATLDEICEILPAPDFPTRAEIITPKSELKAMYQSGNGMVKLRAIYETEDDEIIITALPHQVSGAKILEQIAKQMQEKKLPQIADLRDESDHENPTRLVIVPRSNRIDVEALMSHLFVTTDLEKSVRVNLNMIGVNGRPQTKNLLTILTEWLQFRTQTVIRRLQFRLEKILARLHLLEGFLIAYLNLDEVSKIIREEDEPKAALIARFKLSVLQAEAILEIKLRQLAKLEEIKIREESDRLQKEQAEIEHILNHEKALKKLIKTELTEDAKRYGDPRRSRLVERQQAQIMAETERVAQDPVTIVLSEKGWIRVAKGLEIDAEKLSYKSGDSLLMTVQGRANQLAVFFDSTGRTYSVPAHTLPSARGQGEPLTGKFNLPPSAFITAVTIGEPEEFYLLASSNGYGFIAKQADLYSKNRSGKTTLTLSNESQILLPKKIIQPETAKIAALCSSGRLLIFPANELPFLAKGKGNKILQCKDSEKLLDLVVLESENNQTQLIIVDEQKKDFTIKKQDLIHFEGKRGQRGHALPRGLNHPKGLKVNIL